MQGSARPSGRTGATTGQVPFVKPLGLDFIITAEGRAYLIELQHGFGRRGLRRLFPEANQSFRRTYHRLLRTRPRSECLHRGLRHICGDKGRTYRLFSAYQPATLIVGRWDRRTERWLEELPSPLVLAKPPQGSCGRGIRVYARQALLLSGRSALPPRRPLLLQEYVRSRPLVDDQGRPHVGCIRHVLLMDHDGQRLAFMHLPSYWRVSPIPCGARPDRDALTANVSRGAFAVGLTDEEEETIRQLSEEICGLLLQHILRAQPPAKGDLTTGRRQAG